jgi:hypothetical protein
MAKLSSDEESNSVKDDFVKDEHELPSAQVENGAKLSPMNNIMLMLSKYFSKESLYEFYSKYILPTPLPDSVVKKMSIKVAQ